MPLLKIVKPFKFAHEGIRVEEFTPSRDPVDLTDECAAVAVAERWAVDPSARGSVKTKATTEAITEAPGADLIDGAQGPSDEAPAGDAAPAAQGADAEAGTTTGS